MLLSFFHFKFPKWYVSIVFKNKWRTFTIKFPNFSIILSIDIIYSNYNIINPTNHTLSFFLTLSHARFINSLCAIRFFRERAPPIIFCAPQNITKHALSFILALYSLISDAGIELSCCVILVTKNRPLFDRFASFFFSLKILSEGPYLKSFIRRVLCLYRERFSSFSRHATRLLVEAFFLPPLHFDWFNPIRLDPFQSVVAVTVAVAVAVAVVATNNDSLLLQLLLLCLTWYMRMYCAQSNMLRTYCTVRYKYFVLS